jgi:Helix-turn-helix domain
MGGEKIRDVETQNRDGSFDPITPVVAPVGALKLKSAAEYLGGVSVATMHRLIKRGLLRPNRATRHLLFPLNELDRFLRDGQQ